MAVTTALQEATSRAIREQDTFGVTVALVTLELVALSWLVLFLSVADLVQARSQEVGLARLRGLSRGQVWRFGLGDPVTLIVAALPVGLLASWPVAAALSRVLLGADVPVSVDRSAWVAAAGAVAGGLLAAGLAARATLTNPVTEQWRQTRSHPRRRSWVPDAVVLALVSAGLIELTTAGLVTSPSGRHVAGLLVPALLAIGVALIAARALPYACRAAFGLTRRRGGIGAFLGLRQIARAPGTANTVIVLAVSFALATFAISAWSVTADNHRQVARTHNGAATLLVVTPPEGSALTQLVDQADPGGRSAAAVAIYDRGVRLLAVDTNRLAHVAYWQPAFADEPLSELLPQLRPPAAPQIMLSGEQIRVAVDTDRVPDPGITLHIDLQLPTRPGSVRLALSGDDAEPGVLSRSLSRACHESCELRGFTVESNGPAAHARLIVGEVEVGSAGLWRTVDAGLTDSSRWRAETLGHVDAQATGTPDGLELTFVTGTQTLAVAATHPKALPALIVGQVGSQHQSQVTGLDGNLQQISSVARARAAPGATGPTALVDYQLAEAAAFGISGHVQHQVWLAPGAATRIRQELQGQGVTVTSEQTVDGLVRRFNREGPGLAMALLLASAAAAAVLAMARAVLRLYATGRRRTYELAALDAIGVSPRAQRAALLIEQAITLGVGVLAGVLAGVTAASIALQRVPQFTIPPSTPPLNYTPDPLVLAGVATSAAAAVALAAVLTTEAIRRSAQIDQLQEAPR